MVIYIRQIEGVRLAAMAPLWVEGCSWCLQRVNSETASQNTAAGLSPAPPPVGTESPVRGAPKRDETTGQPKLYMYSMCRTHMHIHIRTSKIKKIIQCKIFTFFHSLLELPHNLGQWSVSEKFAVEDSNNLLIRRVIIRNHPVVETSSQAVLGHVGLSY